MCRSCIRTYSGRLDLPFMCQFRPLCHPLRSLLVLTVSMCTLQVAGGKVWAVTQLSATKLVNFSKPSVIACCCSQLNLHCVFTVGRNGRALRFLLYCGYHCHACRPPEVQALKKMESMLDTLHLNSLRQQCNSQ